MALTELLLSHFAWVQTWEVWGCRPAAALCFCAALVAARRRLHLGAAALEGLQEGGLCLSGGGGDLAADPPKASGLRGAAHQGAEVLGGVPLGAGGACAGVLPAHDLLPLAAEEGPPEPPPHFGADQWRERAFREGRREEM